MNLQRKIEIKHPALIEQSMKALDEGLHAFLDAIRPKGTLPRMALADADKEYLKGKVTDAVRDILKKGIIKDKKDIFDITDAALIFKLRLENKELEPFRPEMARQVASLFNAGNTRYAARVFKVFRPPKEAVITELCAGGCTKEKGSDVVEALIKEGKSQ